MEEVRFQKAFGFIVPGWPAAVCIENRHRKPLWSPLVSDQYQSYKTVISKQKFLYQGGLISESFFHFQKCGKSLSSTFFFFTGEKVQDSDFAYIFSWEWKHFLRLSHLYVNGIFFGPRIRKFSQISWGSSFSLNFHQTLVRYELQNSST